MKTTRTLRVLLVLMALAMILPLAVACKKNGSPATSTEDSAPVTEAPTEAESRGPFDAPLIPVDPNASVYSGTPDTSWYTSNKTEYTLTTADQFAGMLAIRQSTKATFEGITIKLARDLIINQGTVEEFLAAEKIHELQPLNSNYLFKGTFDGQGHTVSGIYIKCTTSAVRGLFGGLGDNATIKNLTLTNCYAASTVPTTEQKSVLGILAAKVNGTNVLISGVKVSGIMEEDTAKFHTVDALLGRVEKNGSVTLEGCEVSGSMSFGTYGYQCGSLIGTVLSNATVNVLSCKSDMNITATNYCGGLIGYDNGATIVIDQSSTYTGTITCPGTHSNVIGNK